MQRTNLDKNLIFEHQQRCNLVEIKKTAYSAALVYILGVSKGTTFCDNGIYERPAIDL